MFVTILIYKIWLSVFTQIEMFQLVHSNFSFSFVLNVYIKTSILIRWRESTETEGTFPSYDSRSSINHRLVIFYSTSKHDIICNPASLFGLETERTTVLRVAAQGLGVSSRSLKIP